LHAEITIDKKAGPAVQEMSRLAVPGTTYSAVFSYWEKGDSFNYLVRKKGPDSPEFVARQARSGTFDQSLTPIKGGTLNLTHRPMGKLWLDSENATFLPFGFLARAGSQPDFHPRVPSLHDVLDPNLWTELASTGSLLVISPSKDEDIATLVLKAKGGVDATHEPAEHTYEVKLSKKYGYFPIGYKKLRKTGQVVFEVECKELVEARSNDDKTGFTYPRETLFRNYNQSGVLMIEIVSRINVLEVNAIGQEAEEELFKIDPASASLIHDLDNNTFMEVPR
jgi:hypothetical protein